MVHAWVHAKNIEIFLLLQTESENKYELLAQKLKVKEGEAQRSTEKADGIECKFIEIEDELKVVGQKQQTLEVGEEQSMLREEKLQKQINELNVKLTMANARYKQQHTITYDISNIPLVKRSPLNCKEYIQFPFSRSENSEMDIGRLNVRIDKVGRRHLS